MSNDSAASEWESKAADWVRHDAIFDRSFAAITEALWERAAISPGDGVLDVGCGAGALLARARAAGARAHGIDISGPMVDAARERVPEATVALADAQSADILAETGAAPFDSIISRFGVMFFADPGAAFANLRRAAAPGGRLSFASWHHTADNIFWHGLRRVAESFPSGYSLPSVPGVDSPGPLGLATSEKINSVLTAGGWTRIDAAPLTAEVTYGTDGSDGVDERMQVALSGNIGRALREAIVAERGESGWDAASGVIHEEVADSVRGGHVRFDATVWIVSATAE